MPPQPRFDLCIVPAAGWGTRMGLDGSTPKCLQVAAGKPILQHILEYWSAHSHHLVVVVNEVHRGQTEDAVSRWVVTRFARVIVRDPAHPYLPQGILDALRGTWVPETFLIVLGDTLVDGTFDWDKLPEGAHGIATTAGDPDFSRSYAVGVGNGRVFGVLEKPTQGLRVYAFRWTALRALEEETEITAVVGRLAREERVVVVPYTGRHLNVTTKEDLARWETMR